jgi:hypothetical protein
MIRGVHAMFYSSEPEAFRAFARDKLELPFTDVGHGWLIFDFPEGDLGCHPVEAGGPPSGTPSVSFYCDDVAKTVQKLRARGVEFLGDVQDQGWGLVTRFRMPGNVEVQLYQPRYRKRRAAAAKAAKAAKAAPRKATAKKRAPARKKKRSAR